MDLTHFGQKASINKKNFKIKHKTYEDKKSWDYICFLNESLIDEQLMFKLFTCDRKNKSSISEMFSV